MQRPLLSVYRWVTRKQSLGLFFILGVIFGYLFTDVCLELMSRSRGSGKVYYSDTWGDGEEQQPVLFTDWDAHENDNHSYANILESRVRVLCLVMTSELQVNRRAVHTKVTWGRRCNHVIYISDKANTSFPTVTITTNDGSSLTNFNTMDVYDYVISNKLDAFDWLLVAKDDVYVIMENLRYMLSGYSPDEAVYFKHYTGYSHETEYSTAGAGYVLSREALRLFAERPSALCLIGVAAADEDVMMASVPAADDDVMMERCLHSLGIVAGETRDSLKRTRFHALPPESRKLSVFPDWRDTLRVPNMSDYAVTFRVTSAKAVYTLEYFTYHASVFGVLNDVQDINPDTQAM